MKNHGTQALCSLFFFAAMALFSCSPLRTAGGSEIGNPTAKVKGTVVYPGAGGFVAGADVRLRPKSFCKDTTLAALSKVAASNTNAMTDASGRFALDSVDTGEYFIEVNDGKSHAALIPCSVDGATSELSLPVDTALPTSPVSGTIMAAKNGSAVYIQVYGLDRVVRADCATGQFVLPDVPQGIFDLRILSSTPQSIPYTKSNVSVESGLGTNIGVIDLVSFGGWTDSRKLLFNTTASGAGVSGNVTNFPALVRLTQSTFDFSKATANGADLRFTKPDGTPLPCQIERFDPFVGMAEVWIKIDTVFGDDSTHYVNMYWGASTLGSTGSPRGFATGDSASSSNGAAVFDTTNGFQGVWHLAEAGNTTAKDATINGYHGTPYNMSAASTVSGPIGLARKFDGVSNFIQMTGTTVSKLNFSQDGFYTISAWVWADTLDYGAIGSVRRDMTIVGKDNCQYALKCFRTNFEFDQYRDAIGWEASISPAVTATWKYVVGVRAGKKQYLYVDGICMTDSVNFTDTSSRAWSWASDVTIGKAPPGTAGWAPYFFKGKLDEIRISNIALSADWIRLCFMNQRVDDKLIVIK